MAVSFHHPLRSLGAPTTLSKSVLHPQHEEIEAHVNRYLCDIWEWPSTRARLGFLSWKLSDIPLRMFATGDYERVKLACELLLLGFLMDDWFEHQAPEHSSMVVLRLSTLRDAPECFDPLTNIERMHHSIFTRILAQRPAAGFVRERGGVSLEQRIIDQYIEMLFCHCDCTRADISSFPQYLNYREVDFGINICSSILYWTENISLSPEKMKTLEPLERIANYHVMILNDIFSFDREWKAYQEYPGTAIMVNGVSLLAAQTHIGVEAAKIWSYSLVRAWELEFKKMIAGLKENGEVCTDEMRRMIQCIERRMTGAEEFYWQTKRYL